MRCSVRALVEFTFHGQDIYPGLSLKSMQEGMLGHKARQAVLDEGWMIEAPIRITLQEDEQEIEIHGRMDAYLPGTRPAVEEIKLWHAPTPPEAPVDAHLAQAMCYAHMLCCRDGCSAVDVRVAYVDRNGHIQAAFSEERSASACKEAFISLYLPWLRRIKQLQAHQHARDASILAMQFPFPAYRAGQREMAVQVYTAVQRKRRLYASLPTGIGKSIAACFPALKALGCGLTGQVFYLTARTTQRQAPLEAIALLRKQHLCLWTLTLNAKAALCPEHTHCHPDWCPRAKGHFLRDHQAIDELLQHGEWSTDQICAAADRYQLCPFELSLSLAEMADFIICDYNYAFDPAVHLQRIFDRSDDVTLLVDEAHNLLSRTRDMLSGTIDSNQLRALRTSVGKTLGRKHFLYQSITGMLNALVDLPVPQGILEGSLEDFPQSIDKAAASLADALKEASGHFLPADDNGERMNEISSSLYSFVRSRRQKADGFACLWSGSERTRSIIYQCLDPSEYLSEVTCRLSGSVYFSATLSPLQDMRLLLGGCDQDACFSAPSPFPPENLTVIQKSINTRYRFRQQAVEPIAHTIKQLYFTHPGKYIVFFPSFVFMNCCAEQLTEVSFQLQQRSMNEADRGAFLSPYLTGTDPVLSLCVMGGIFSEGIDLPGPCLDGVVIIGTGLPQVNQLQNELQSYYQRRFGQGFRYAYLIPGMQKVIQAVGRVIRTETDHGIALLLDDRYTQPEIRSLCPPEWQVTSLPVMAPIEINVDSSS